MRLWAGTTYERHVTVRGKQRIGTVERRRLGNQWDSRSQFGRGRRTLIIRGLYSFIRSLSPGRIVHNPYSKALLQPVWNMEKQEDKRFREPE